MTILYSEAGLSASAGSSGILVCDKTAQAGISTVAKLTGTTAGRKLRGCTHTGTGNLDITVPVSGLYQISATIVIAAGSGAFQWTLGFGAGTTFIGFGAGTTFISYAGGLKTASVEFSLQYNALLELDDGVTYSFLATCGTSADIASGQLRLVQSIVY